MVRDRAINSMKRRREYLDFVFLIIFDINLLNKPPYQSVPDFFEQKSQPEETCMRERFYRVRISCK